MIFFLGIGQAYAADEAEEAAPKSSAYVSLGDPMVLNLSGGKRLTFLQISADVLVADSDAERTIKVHVPAIRHSLIMLLSEQNAKDIKSPARREEIRQQATARVKGLIADLSGSQDVSDVLFSSILVQ
jgi:flagellar FliL protein